MLVSANMATVYIIVLLDENFSQQCEAFHLVKTLKEASPVLFSTVQSSVITPRCNFFLKYTGGLWPFMEISFCPEISTTPPFKIQCYGRKDKG